MRRAWIAIAAASLLGGCIRMNFDRCADDPPHPDCADLDAGPDGSVDGGVDAGTDASLDASLDAGSDASLDASLDADLDAS